MGVPGLWDLIRPAATRTSLSTLAKEAVLKNHNGLRALTIGIDASIWIFHAQLPQHGENPFLRTIFFKITTLLQHPVLPVFVFDGPNKPGRKRNERVAGSFGTADWRSKRFKELLDVCGLEWWNAPGEAEAELAVMNRQGKIDAVLSDDVDALLFGATCLLRNNSPTLSGAQASSTQNNSNRGDLRHYEVYRSEAIKDLWTSKENTMLKTEEDCRRAMVLVALLGGGDYAPEGLSGFGPTITHALAHAGLADFLRLYNDDPSAFPLERSLFLSKAIDELRTDASKHIGRKFPSRATTLSEKIPDEILPAFALDAYLKPAVSPPDPLQGWPGFGKGEASTRRGKARNTGRGDMEGMAKACEQFFEWGTKDLVVKKFGSEHVGIFSGQVINEARESITGTATPPPRRSASPLRKSIDAAAGPSRITAFFSQATSSQDYGNTKAYSLSNSPASPRGVPPHVIKIHSTRPDPLNPDLKEYRVAYRHEGYVARCRDAMEGRRCDPSDLSPEQREAIGLVNRLVEDEDLPSATQCAAGSSKSELRVWMPEYLLREAWPSLVAAYEEELRNKAEKLKSPKKKIKTVAAPPRNVVRGKKAPTRTTEDPNRFKGFFTQLPRGSTSRSRSKSPSPTRAPQDSSNVIEILSSPVKEPSLPKTKNTRPRPPSSSSSLPTSSRSPTPSTAMTSQRSSSPIIIQTVRTRRKNVPGTPSSSQSKPSPRVSNITRAVTRSITASGGKKKPVTVIDLCSSDEDDTQPPSPPRSPSRRKSKSPSVGVLTGSSRANVLSTSPPSRPSSSTSRGKNTKPLSSQSGITKSRETSKQGKETQTRLNMPVVARASSPLSAPISDTNTKQDVSSVTTKAKSSKKLQGKKSRLSMVVLYEDDDVEIIDSTRGRCGTVEPDLMDRLKAAPVV